MKTTREMKEAIRKMLDLYEESERLFDVDEEASDKIYEQASAICSDIVEAIVKASHGMIERNVARAMVIGKSDKLIAICEKFC